MSGQHTLNRREVLAAAVAGGALAGVGTAGAALAAAGSSPYDAIVIGGGFAGVTAARNLGWLGRRTLLLEAHARLGGRTFTSRYAGHSIDLGGTWVGLEQPFVTAERMRYGIGVAESAAFQAGERGIYVAGGERHDVPIAEYSELFSTSMRRYMSPAVDVFPRAFEPFYSDAWKKYDNVTSLEALEALKLPQPAHDITASLAAINGHNYLDQISYLDQLKWYALGAYDPARLFDNLGRFRIEGGTKRLLDAIAKDFRGDVRLGTPVASVTKDGEHYAVTTQDDETFHARAIIVAVPLNVLASIRFEPGISAAKMAASRERITGAGTKLYVRIKGTQPVFMAQGPEKNPLNFLWSEYVDADSQVLVGFGPDPKRLDINDIAAVRAAVQQFVPDAEVLDSVGYGWNEDPYALGTWCMYRPGFFGKYLRELQTPEGRVFIAGADIANGWRGFIDGAIESGSRNAELAHRALGS
jgi:monoamine oxidase